MGVQDSLVSLWNSDAHIVLCNPEKKPIHRGYMKQRPGLEAVLDHADLLGLVPWSLGLSALDLDHGNPEPIVRDFPPLISVPTKRQGGFHFYYRDVEGRGNANWEHQGASGQIRSERGFLVLHKDAATHIEKALRTGNQAAFPISLIPKKEHALFHPTKRHNGNPSQRSLDFSGPLEEVPVGKRNNVIFDSLHAWADTAERGPDMGEWLGFVFSYGLELNSRLPSPLPREEVYDIAGKVGRFRWTGCPARRDHSRTTQTRRQQIRTRSGMRVF